MQSEYTKSLQILVPIYAVFRELSKNFEAPEVRYMLAEFKLNYIFIPTIENGKALSIRMYSVVFV